MTRLTCFEWPSCNHHACDVEVLGHDRDGTQCRQCDRYHFTCNDCGEDLSNNRPNPLPCPTPDLHDDETAVSLDAALCGAHPDLMLTAQTVAAPKTDCGHCHGLGYQRHRDGAGYSITRSCTACNATGKETGRAAEAWDQIETGLSELQDAILEAARTASDPTPLLEASGSCGRTLDLARALRREARK